MHNCFFFSQGLGNVYRSGNLGTCRSVACFPAFGVAPSISGILGVRYAYQPKKKQQQKRNEVPSYRIGVTKSQDSFHTGTLLTKREGSTGRILFLTV